MVYRAQQLVLAVCFTFSFSSVWAYSCKNLFLSSSAEYFKAHFGEQVKSISSKDIATLELIPEIKAKKIFYLGRGWHGYVFRIYSADKTYILKIYKNKFDAKTDLLLLKKIEQALGDNELLKVPKVKKGPSENSFIFEDIRGETLERVDDFSLLKSKYLKRLLERYAKGLKILGPALERLYGVSMSKNELRELKKDIDYEYGYYPFLTFDMEGRGRELKDKYLVDPRNILVDHKTLQLYIIDPY